MTYIVERYAKLSLGNPMKAMKMASALSSRKKRKENNDVRMKAMKPLRGTPSLSSAAAVPVPEGTRGTGSIPHLAKVRRLPRCAI